MNLGNIMIAIYSLIIGILIVIVPFIISLILVKKLTKERDKSVKIEERVNVLEAEIKEIKDYLDIVDEL